MNDTINGVNVVTSEDKKWIHLRSAIKLWKSFATDRRETDLNLEVLVLVSREIEYVDIKDDLPFSPNVIRLNGSESPDFKHKTFFWHLDESKIKEKTGLSEAPNCFSPECVFECSNKKREQLFAGCPVILSDYHSPTLCSESGFDMLYRRLRELPDIRKLIKSNLPEGDAEHALSPLSRGMTRSCFYTLYFPSPQLTDVEKDLKEILLSNGMTKFGERRLIVREDQAKHGIIKIGITTEPVRRFTELISSFGLYAKDVKILRCEELGCHSLKLETKLFQTLREKGVMPPEPECNVFVRYKSRIGKFVPMPSRETVVLTDSFGIPEYDKIVEIAKSQLGIVGQAALTDKQLFKLEKRRLKDEKKQKLLAMMTPEARDRLIEKMLG